MSKICLLPRVGLPLLGSSECLETLRVEKVEKMTLQEDLDTRVEFIMLEYQYYCTDFLLCYFAKYSHIKFTGSILVSLHL